MEKRWLALVALLTAAAAAFVGCSCGNKVNNSIDDSDQIEVQSDVTVSSDLATTVTTDATSIISTTTTTGTGTSDSSETGTTVSKKVQFVGNGGGGRVTTAKTVVITVVVTVTKPPVNTTPPEVSTTASTTETTLVTVNMPDGMFTPSQDLCFTIDEIAMKVGEMQPALGSLAQKVSDGTPVYGGTAAYIYTCDGYRVNTEVMTMADGTTQEQITEIVLTGDNVCTNKGITRGSSVDSIIAAYGSTECEIVDTYTYRYKTDDGYILDFHTNGTAVTEILYYKSVV